MNLVIDFGNTNVKYAIFHHNEMVLFKSLSRFSFQSLNLVLKKYPKIKNICFSGHVEFESELQKISNTNNIQYFRVNYKLDLPIKIKYKSPETLGADRIALAVAASKNYSGDLLIIDLGTCITYDLVVSNNYLGGQISPGLNMRFLSLADYTKTLPKLQYLYSDDTYGANTNQSITIGVQDSVHHEIDQVILKYKFKYPSINIIATGGDIAIIKNKRNVNFINPYLLMEGLNYIIAFNE